MRFVLAAAAALAALTAAFALPAGAHVCRRPARSAVERSGS